MIPLNLLDKSLNALYNIFTSKYLTTPMHIASIKDKNNGIHLAYI